MEGKWQISTGGAASAPIWGPQGREIFYLEQGGLMKVDVGAGAGVSFSRPQKVCNVPASLFSISDISEDGKRFLVTISAEEEQVGVTQLNVVSGWFSVLEKKFSSLEY
jgi:hypothetical protein